MYPNHRVAAVLDKNLENDWQSELLNIPKLFGNNNLTKKAEYYSRWPTRAISRN